LIKNKFLILISAILFQFNILFSNQNFLLDDTALEEFKNDIIEFSKNDKEKLNFFISKIIKEIVDSDNNLSLLEKTDIASYIFTKIISQCNSILNNKYNLKLSKNLWKSSGFTITSLNKEKKDLKSEIKFYFDNNLNKTFKIESIENIISKKIGIYFLKKAINKYFIYPIYYSFKGLDIHSYSFLNFVSNLETKLQNNLKTKFEKKEDFINHSFSVKTERSIFNSSSSNKLELNAKMLISVKKNINDTNK